MPQRRSNNNTTTPKKRARGVRLTPEQKTAAQTLFLTVFAQSANLTAACRRAGIDRSTVYRWQEHDTAFTVRYHEAEAEANDVVRAAIFQRAVNGVDKPLHHNGRLVRDEDGRPVTVKDYSDTLLIFLAKARMPEFRDKQQVEISGQLDINTLAAEADAKFSAFLAATRAAEVLGKPDGGAEG